MPEDNSTDTSPAIPPQNQTTTGASSSTAVNPAAASAPAVSNDLSNSTIVTPSIPDLRDLPEEPSTTTNVYSEVVKKIGSAHNVLIALSSDPSVDEMATAIGLSLYLDRLGKRATAIYSGSTPNALEFLKPEDTFENSADTLQDFVIALNKDKADHLRYKLDGDFVKIFITPYKTRISEDDLDFSYGDFNVDLVLALDVANGIDLDSALREHGRIMHDAVIVNITTGKPGKFGEIELSDKSASSVAEIIAKLLYGSNSKIEISKEEATAFLTGIVAATNRFSNTKTTPETMRISSKLMESGANQQLISKNITPDIENEMYSMNTNEGSQDQNTLEQEVDPTKLNIEHGTEKPESTESNTGTTAGDEPPKEPLTATSTDASPSTPENTATNTNTDLGTTKEVTVGTNADSNATKDVATDTLSTDNNSEEASHEADQETPQDNSLLDDLKAAEASLSRAGAETAPDIKASPVRIENSDPTLPPVMTPADSEPSSEANESFISDKPEKVIAPSEDFDQPNPEEDSGVNKYGQMLEDALASVNAPATAPGGAPPTPTPTPAEPSSIEPNPASINAPTVATNPEINGVPEMNYMPMPGEEVLPPPPTPPIDVDANNMPNTSSATAIPPVAPLEPTLPVPEPAQPSSTAGSPTAPLGPQPAMQDQVYTPQAADPSAFKIPGM